MSAQEEFNQLVNSNRSRFTSHPEDHDLDSDPHFSDDEPSSRLRSRQTLDSSDEDDDADMVSSRTANANYHIPNTVYEANTGPKGVIADAQAFERARKKSFRRTLLSVAGLDSNSPSFGSKSTRDDAPLTPGDQSSASEDDDEARFLRKWRQSRMHELQGRNNRRPSPRGRQFGSVETVDAVGYLDAIEKVTPDTVVVVCIYDHEVCVKLVPWHVIAGLEFANLFGFYSLMIALSSKNALLLLLADNQLSASLRCTKISRRWTTSRPLLCWHTVAAMSLLLLSMSCATFLEAVAAVLTALRTC